jgi:hypothetical protein
MTPEEQVAQLLKDVAEMPTHRGSFEVTHSDLMLILTTLTFTIKTVSEGINEAELPIVVKVSILSDLKKMVALHDRIKEAMR